MTDIKPEGDWLKVTSRGPDDPMFELDSVVLKIVCNQNNKHFIKIAAFLQKLTGKAEFPLRYMMLSLSVAYLILKASKINPSTRIEIYNRFVRCIKSCIKTIAVVKPDAKSRGKDTARVRREIFGDTQSTLSSHKRNPPPMHFQCPTCEGPGEGSTKKKYEQRKQYWRNITHWIRKHEKDDGTNALRDYFTRPKEQDGCGLEIQDYNVDELWKEYKTSEFNKIKKRSRKYPRKNEKLKSVTAENIKTDLENEGIPVADIPANDPLLKDKAEDILLYIRSFRTRRPMFNKSKTPRDDTWKEVARMYNTNNWEQIKTLVYQYCHENDMDIEATLGSKENKISTASDEHDEHNSKVSTEAKRTQHDDKDTDEDNNDHNNETSSNAPI